MFIHIKSEDGVINLANVSYFREWASETNHYVEFSYIGGTTRTVKLSHDSFEKILNGIGDGVSIISI